MSDINQFVAPLTAQTDEVAEWPPLQFRVRTYLTALLPPLNLVTSIRALVFNHGHILVVRDPISTHILPGGRREVGETLLQTLQREVLEETGWSIRDMQFFGFAHFHHLTLKTVAYQYPYPDFLHLVYLANAEHYQPEQRHVDGYELEAGFQPLERVMTLALSQGERVFLMAASQKMIPGTRST